MTKFDRDYKEILHRIVADGALELNRRTGVAVRALPGITIQVDLEKDGFPLLSLRKIPMSFIPEIMWMLSGRKDTTWLSGFTKIWDSFKDKDGTISSAYGYRWRHAFDVDQIDEVIRKLSEDPSTRHGVVQIWDAREDLTVPQKNVPCPVMFTLNIINGRLNLHLVIRSNDMVLGHPTDIAGFALLNHLFASRLNVLPGVLTVSISNAHIYENQMDAVREILSRESSTKHIRLVLPENAYSRACGLDSELVGELKAAVCGYTPGPAIKNIPIAL